MHYTFFQIPAIDPDVAAKRLNAFIQSQSVIGIERQFVADGLNSFWSICVTTAPPGGSGLSDQATAKKRTRVDYREVLSPEAFIIFDRLRTLRNSLAEEKGIPAYAIFTNDQLATMANMNNPDRASLVKIEGIGQKRIEMYADLFLHAMVQSAG